MKNMSIQAVNTVIAVGKSSVAMELIEDSGKKVSIELTNDQSRLLGTRLLAVAGRPAEAGSKAAFVVKNMHLTPLPDGGVLIECLLSEFESIPLKISAQLAAGLLIGLEPMVKQAVPKS
jgi:hypothetical protein